MILLSIIFLPIESISLSNSSIFGFLGNAYQWQFDGYSRNMLFAFVFPITIGITLPPFFSRNGSSRFANLDLRKSLVINAIVIPD